MDTEQILREHLLTVLDGRQAHLTFDEIVAGVACESQGARVKGSPHTLWQLLEHMRIAQWDILEFSRDPSHVSPNFPKGYWPPDAEPPNRSAWDESVRAFKSDLEAMKQLVADRKTDLYAPIPHGQGQTILREALLVADHNAYHLGQMLLLRRQLGDPPVRSLG
ncbi:MAG: DinB family protein [Acidobacteriota bacterium]|nr:MAG: DinB family protein [Acidobacteriota bacterium]